MMPLEQAFRITVDGGNLVSSGRKPSAVISRLGGIRGSVALVAFVGFDMSLLTETECVVPDRGRAAWLTLVLPEYVGYA
jgi:hypothetical protein